MKSSYICILLFFVSILISGDPYIADQNGQTVNPGDNVYIYGIGEPEGFSLDYPRELFMEGGSIQVFSGCISLGALRSDIIGGRVDTVLFNTQFGTLPIPLPIVNRVSALKLEKQNLTLKERVKGKITFGSGGGISGKGIDSVIVRFEDSKRLKHYDYLIADESSGDSLQNGIIDFSIEPVKDIDDYFVSVIFYSFGVSDTSKDIAGFTTKAADEDNEAILVIDCSRGDMTEELLGDYYDSGVYVHPVFFRGGCDSLLQSGRFKTAAIVAPGCEGILSRVSGLSEILEEAKRIPVFLFTSGMDTLFEDENLKDAGNYFEMMMGIRFSPDSLSDYASIGGMRSIDGFRASKIYDLEAKRYTQSKIRNNIFLYMFIPDRIDAEELERIASERQNREVSSKYFVYGGIQRVFSDSAGEADILFYRLSGAFERSIDGIWIEEGESSVNLFHYMRMISDMRDGCYLFKIEKEGICIKSGKVFFVR